MSGQERTVRVFNVNKAIGPASSGVEYAQAYRRELFAGIPWVDDYYVFTDYLPTNLCVFTDMLGFERARVLWVYHLVTGRETQPCTITVDEYLETIGQSHEPPQAAADVVDVALTGSPVSYRIRTVRPGPDGGDGEQLVDRVETLLRDQVVRVEHYDASLSNVEHFHENRLVRREFYTADGRVAAQQLYRDREITRTLITPASPLYRQPLRRGRHRATSYLGDLVIDGRSQFFQFVFARLLDRPDDTVIVDRALDVIDGIYPVIGDHRLYSVVHAEHFDLTQAEEGVLLWNNHYENVFTRPELVDGFIVSTHRQKEVLAAQLAERLPAGGFSVVRIPVGVAHEPAPRGAGAERDRYAVVTASRLAEEKHIDLLIRAVALARAELPGIRLDVYGEGARDRLIAAIAETGSHEYVRLMGHHRLEGLLGGYALYATASTSEGFGLSLLEALAEGLPIVGFDVDYGNREMVEHGVNGLLVPRGAELDPAGLAAAIVELLSSDDLDGMRRASLGKAEQYRAAHVRAQWERLLREEDPC